MFFDDEAMGTPTDGGMNDGSMPADDTATDTEEKEEGGETAAM
jgi:hypothetical protein